MAAPASPIPDPAVRKPPRPKRWIPVSLRMLVAILVLVGLGSALWIGVPANRQLVAIREIERVGGSYRSVPTGPMWLRQWLGDSREREAPPIMSRVSDH